MLAATLARNTAASGEQGPPVMCGPFFCDALTGWSTFASAAAIAVTACFAIMTYRQFRYYEKVRLTVAMMESPWLLQAWNNFGQFLSQFATLDEARNFVAMHVQYPALIASLARTQVDQLSPALGSLTYVAALFSARYYDDDVLLARGYLTILQAYYIFEGHLAHYVRAKVYDKSVFDLGIAAAKRAAQDRDLSECFPQLAGFFPGHSL